MSYTQPGEEVASSLDVNLLCLPGGGEGVEEAVTSILGFLPEEGVVWESHISVPRHVAREGSRGTFATSSESPKFQWSSPS